MNIRDKLSNIQSKFKAKKSRFNNFGKYNFRSAEDISGPACFLCSNDSDYITGQNLSVEIGRRHIGSIETLQH